jgi:hypothetical protein
MRDAVEMQVRLHAYRDFSECVVTAIEWRDFATTVVISVDYPWTASGTVRPDDSVRLIVDVEFRLVQEFCLKSGLPVEAIESPDVISWGLTEISVVQITNAPQQSGMKLFRAMIRREGWTWIEIVFARLSISERTVPPENGPAPPSLT